MICATHDRRPIGMASRRRHSGHVMLHGRLMKVVLADSAIGIISRQTAGDTRREYRPESRIVGCFIKIALQFFHKIMLNIAGNNQLCWHSKYLRFASPFH